ncbi:MAG: hypothetical protein KKD86_01435 [Bacteroidetes bacterium]|nr:hypothetical protein [Bacteroidota bacterium]
MKERKLKTTVVFMAIAVVGLIAVQIYWIMNAFSIEEIKFKSSANEALLSVVNKIDKNETASVIIKKISKGKEDVFFLGSDSLHANALWVVDEAHDKVKRKIQVSANDEDVN